MIIYFYSENENLKNNFFNYPIKGLEGIKTSNYILIYNKRKGDNLVTWFKGLSSVGSYIEQISTVRLEQN